MSKENDKEKNHFLDLVEKFGDVIEEKHLEMLLKSQLDLISKVYIWILTAFIGIGGAATAIKLVIDPLSIWGYVSLFLVICVVIVLYIFSCVIKKIDPLKLKGDLLQRYLIAKRRLNEIKKQTTKTQ